MQRLQEATEPKSYAELWMHREMLRDRVRCDAYKDAIDQLVSQDSVVLDVGTGSGIMSLLACKAGARKVYAVERTSISSLAKEISGINEMAHKIDVIESDVERVNLPEKVDMIISEWMGGFGVDENLLGPVLQARDAWLKEGGVMVPGVVESWFAPGYDTQMADAIEFWRSMPYGVDLSPVGEATIREQHNARHHISESDLRTVPKMLWRIDTRTFSLEAAREGFSAASGFEIAQDGPFNGLALWFEADLGGGAFLTNRPGSPRTHWGVTFLPIGEVYHVKKGTTIEASVTCTPMGPNLCQTSWAVKLDRGPWNHYRGQQGCVPSSGFH